MEAQEKLPVGRNREAIERNVRELLVLLGQDPSNPAIAETPRRVAAWWCEFFDHDPGRLGTTFDEKRFTGLVVVAGLRVWSLCEHHLLPFWCDVAIGYKPCGKVLGLSKFGRVAEKHAHRLQLQERLVSDIGQEVAELTGSQDVAVIGSGEHLCMTMRGVGKPHTMTSVFRSGEFLRDGQWNEFLVLCKR